MSLRTRLVLTLLALLALGLVGAALATFAAVHDFLADRADRQLTVTARAITDRAAADQSGLPTLNRSDTVVLAAIADNGEVPSLFQVRDPIGAVTQTLRRRRLRGGRCRTRGCRDPLPAGGDRVWARRGQAVCLESGDRTNGSHRAPHPRRP